MCAAVWQDRTAFIRDNSLELNGYQANFNNLELGLFYFTHKVEGCYTTMTVKAGEFYDLNPVIPLYTGRSRKTFTEECPTHCLHKENLQLCSVQCDCAIVRDLIGVLQTMKSAGES